MPTCRRPGSGHPGAFRPGTLCRGALFGLLIPVRAMSASGLLCHLVNQSQNEALDYRCGPQASGDHYFCSQYLAKGLPDLDSFPEDFGQATDAVRAYPAAQPLGQHLFRGQQAAFERRGPAIASSGPGPALFSCRASPIADRAFGMRLLCSIGYFSGNAVYRPPVRRVAVSHSWPKR